MSKSLQQACYAISTVNSILDAIAPNSISTGNTLQTYYWDSSKGTSGISYPSKSIEYYFSPSYSFPVTKKDYPDYPICNHSVHMETGENILEIAVTGFSKEDLSIKVLDEYLVIKGSAPDSDEQPVYKSIYHGIPKRDFEMKFQIPEKLDSEKITSKIENGVLTVKIPVKEEILKKNRDIVIE